MGKSGRVSLYMSKGSGVSELIVEIEGFKTKDNHISIHQITTNQKFKDDLEVMPFSNGHEYTIEAIANHFMVDEAYAYGWHIDDDGTKTDLLEFQTTGVTAVIDSAESDPTSNTPFNITVVFDRAVSGFASGDLTLTNCTAGAAATGNNITFTIAITPTTDGLVTIALAAGKCTAVSNGKNNITAVPFSITYEAA